MTPLTLLLSQHSVASAKPSGAPSHTGPNLQHQILHDDSGAGHSPYTWQLPEGAEPQSCVWLWVGPEDSPLLQQLQMTLHGAQWAMYSPSEQRWQVLEPAIPFLLYKTHGCSMASAGVLASTGTADRGRTACRHELSRACRRIQSHR